MNNLKKIRCMRKYTQKEVSSNARVAERAYQMYESGQREPKARTAIRIAKVLGTTVEVLWGGNPV